MGRSSRVYDRDFKRDAYLRLGMAEVWLLDLREGVVLVSRQDGSRDVPHRERLSWSPAWPSGPSFACKISACSFTALNAAVGLIITSPRKPAALIDRDQQWQALRQLATLGRPVMGLLYGRRRVGKTYLLRHVWPADQVFYFTASETTSTFNRTELLRAMGTWSGEEIRTEDYPTWRTTFSRLLELRDRTPTVIVLDEYQYIRGEDGDSVDSALNAAWESYIYGRGAGRTLVLMLCGSAVGVMSKLNTGARPLYGRFEWQASLSPFDFRDAARMTGAAEPRDQARYYGIYGGTPRYLATIDARASLAENVARDVLAPDGRVRLQVETALEQESGLADAAEHRAILAAIASGHTDRNTIAQAVGMPLDSTFRSRLDRLVEPEYVGAERNFDAAPNQPYRYRIVDPAQRFYYALVLPYRQALIDPSSATALWRDAIRPRLDGYIGHIFEQMTREAYHHRREQDHLPLVKDWGRWEGRDRNREALEIDIVARATDGRLITGAVKWNARPVSPTLHTEHIAALHRLASSGYRWAHDALKPDAIVLYVSAAGFTEAFADAVRGHGQRVVAWSLSELYR